MLDHASHTEKSHVCDEKHIGTHIYLFNYVFIYLFIYLFTSAHIKTGECIAIIKTN